jgi:hypothetical protein
MCGLEKYSKCVLESCARGKYKSHIKFLKPAIKDLHNLIIAHSKYDRLLVRFTWCPAHKGMEGNEKADLLAKEGSVNSTLINNKISFKDCTSCLLNDYMCLVEKHIKNISPGTGSYYINNFLKIDLKGLTKFRLNKGHFGTIIRITTGLAFTNMRKHKIGLVKSPSCSSSYEEQDLNHIFWACPLLSDDIKKNI